MEMGLRPNMAKIRGYGGRGGRREDSIYTESGRRGEEREVSELSFITGATGWAVDQPKTNRDLAWSWIYPRNGFSWNPILRVHFSHAPVPEPSDQIRSSHPDNVCSRKAASPHSLACPLCTWLHPGL